MLRRLLRSTLFGAATVAAVALPSAASAQSVFFTDCAAPGVCGYVEAFFTASLLTVRVSNMDNKIGSALFSAQLIFTSALNAATPGTAFSPTTSASASGQTVSIGTTPTNAWSFSGVGGSNVLDLASFFNVDIEGKAASAFRAKPGDPDSGTWVTPRNGFVDFTADMSGVTGANGGNALLSLGFCTDAGCAAGTPLVTTPEPATLALFATGLVGVVALRRRRKNV